MVTHFGRSLSSVSQIGWVALLAVGAACAGQSSIEHDRASAAGAVDGPGKLHVSPDSLQPLRVHVEAPGEVMVGSGVPIKLVVTNTGSTLVDVLQVAPAPDYDVTVTQVHGRLVWQRLPPDAMLMTAGLHYRLAPGESRDLETIVWDQRDLHGRQVGPGRYKVHGTFYGGIAYTNQNEIQTDTVSLLIER